MKAMIMSDLIVMRRSLVQLAAICFLCSAVIAVSTGGSLSIVGACFGAMVPLLYLLSVASYDELANWQVYRLTLPMSRSNAVAGRYVGMLIVAVSSAIAGAIASYVIAIIAGLVAVPAGSDGSFMSNLTLAANPAQVIWGGAIGGAAAALAMSAITLPALARFGLRKGTRFIPIVGVVILALSVALFGEGGPLYGILPDMAQLLPTPGAEMAFIAILAALALALYGISFPLSMKLYDTREF